MILDNNKMKIKVVEFPKKKFIAKYGEKTQGVTGPYKKGQQNPQEVHVKRGLTPSRKKLIITHEVGHLVTERGRIEKKIPSLEKKKLLKYYKAFVAGKYRGKESKNAKIREALADIYVRNKMGSVNERKIIKRNLPVTYAKEIGRASCRERV